jgi:hypothetical protein
MMLQALQKTSQAVQYDIAECAKDIARRAKGIAGRAKGLLNPTCQLHRGRFDGINNSINRR